jgi:hypothetical protein
MIRQRYQTVATFASRRVSGLPAARPRRTGWIERGRTIGAAALSGLDFPPRITLP